VNARPVSCVLGTEQFSLRYEVVSTDESEVRTIVDSTGFFHDYEVDIAVELVQERLRRGDASGYFFAFAEQNGVPVGYSCYGPIACTADSYDVFWIAVRKSHQRHGLGRWLMELTEQLIAEAGGRRIYVETSGRPDYLPTRSFYERCQYQKAAELPDFYAEGDSKVIYVKVLGR
jgi:D-alanine-D-alanine ligase